MRSLWIGTLAAALSCSTPGWSQMLQPDRWIMVREEGKPAVKCRVVSTTKQKDGSTVCQAVTEAGEALTLLEEAVKGPQTGVMRMRVLQGPRSMTTRGPLRGVAQPPVDPPPAVPTPTGTPPPLKPVPPPMVMPAVVQATPEPKQDKPSLFGRFFHPTPSKTEVVNAGAEPRPQLPISATTTDDPLSRPDLYTKAAGSDPVPTVVPAPQATRIGKIFDRTPVPVVTTSVQAKEPPPAPVIVPPVVSAVTPSGPLVGLPSAPAPKPPVVLEPKEVKPSLLDRLRSSVASAPTPLPAKPVPPQAAQTPAAPRRLFPTGMGSVVAVRDRAVLGQSPGGAMVRTPTGEMAYVASDHMPQGPNVVPVSASNAFTLAMPNFAPGMPGSMPVMAMPQAPVAYDRGVPEGAANAFTMTGSSRPVPADFGPPPQYPNAFLMDGMGGAYSRPMALAYDPRMGYVPVGGGYPQQHPMLPMPQPAGQILASLRGSVLPSERERAVLMLAQCQGYAQPEAVAAIVVAAKSDPAPAVRICCVRALGQMKIATMPIFETLQELKSDKDPRVRHEAEQTLATMTKH